MAAKPGPIHTNPIPKSSDDTKQMLKDDWKISQNKKCLDLARKILRY
jgi:hypothetical protein